MTAPLSRVEAIARREADATGRPHVVLNLNLAGAPLYVCRELRDGMDPARIVARFDPAPAASVEPSASVVGAPARPASVVALESLNLAIVRAALERAGLPADTALPSAPRAYTEAYATVMCERRKEVFAAIEAAGRDASGMSRHFVEGMAAAYARATVPHVATDGAGYQNTASAPTVEPAASVVGEAQHDAHLTPWVRNSMSDIGCSLWDWSDAEVLTFYYRALNDKSSIWRRAVPSTPAMVSQPCQQQQARARGRAPQPARGERRYVTVRDTETGDVHRVLTSVARVGVAVVIFTPSNRHRQGALNGMLITHDDIRKAWVFNDEAEARRFLSGNRAPGERVIRAELVADPAPAIVPLGGRYVALADGGVEWVADAPTMVPQVAQQQQAKAGATLSDAPKDEQFADAARAKLGDSDGFEVDADAAVSRGSGEPGGAFVACWVWVSNDEASA